MLCLLQVLKKRPDFRENPWPKISPSAKDFVKKLLRKDPRARPTAAQALCQWPPGSPLLPFHALASYTLRPWMSGYPAFGQK